MLFKKIGIGRIMALLALLPALSLTAQGGVTSSSAASMAEQSSVCPGVVKDISGAPLAGVAVSVKGTVNGVSTDLDGKFSLSGVETGDIILIQSIGYKTVEVTWDGNPLDITLEEDKELLDEVVVVGYGTQRKADLTGAVSSVKMDDILGSRPVTSVQDALMGQIPDLQITRSSGTPGDGYTISVRGATGTINGDSSPLILVDNVPADMSLLNPEDVESVTVLKDASSAAIYGARAAFGVILITTKKGSQGRFTVNYSNNFSFSTPWDLPQKASPLETVMAYKDLGWTNHPNYGQNIDTWLNYLNEYRTTPSLYPDGYAMDDTGRRYDLRETDLIRGMMDKFGFQQTHNISAQGGTDKVSYRIGFGYLNENGVVVTDKDSYDRYNVSSYIRSDALKWLVPELDIKFAKADQSTLGDTRIFNTAIWFPSYHPTGYMDLDGESYPYNTPYNFAQLSYPSTNTIENTRVTGRVTIKPFKNFNIVGEYTYDISAKEAESFNPVFEFARGQDYALEASTTPENSKYTYSNTRNTRNNLNIYGDYTLEVKKHYFKAMVGFSQERYWSSTRSMDKANMINQDLPSISGGVGEDHAADSFSEYSIRSGFYRLNYTYDEKYMFTASGRYDGSSKFPKNSRFGFFPSFSAGWRLSRENFMKWSDPVLDNLTLRASWGNIGNQNIGAYAYIPEMAAGKSGWIAGDKPTYTVGAPALVSADFTWERVQTLNFGVDLNMFDNRFSAIFDWYQRDTKGMLAEGVELPAVLGAAAPLENVANLRTKGWGLQVNWRDHIGEVNYNIGFTLSDRNTYITKINNEIGLLSEYYVGQNINEQWGYVTDRYYTEADFDADGNLLPGIPVVEGYTPNPGDVLYKDFNNDGLINSGDNTLGNPGDQKIIGDRSRHYQYGITGGLSWKGISFSFILQGVGQRDMWNDSNLFWPFADADATIFKSQLDYWTPERTDAYFPRVYEKATGNTKANRMKQTKYKLNGAYLNIKNITLSYTFPRELTRKFYVERLSVFFSGEDLYSFDHLENGLHPEAGNTARGWTYPFMRKFSFGVQITL